MVLVRESLSKASFFSTPPSVNVSNCLNAYAEVTKWAEYGWGSKVNWIGLFRVSLIVMPLINMALIHENAMVTQVSRPIRRSAYHIFFNHQLTPNGLKTLKLACQSLASRPNVLSSWDFKMHDLLSQEWNCCCCCCCPAQPTVRISKDWPVENSYFFFKKWSFYCACYMTHAGKKNPTCQLTLSPGQLTTRFYCQAWSDLGSM